MDRVRVKIPNQNTVFEHSYTITIGDINYGNHLSNDKVLTIFHEARVQWFKSMGFQSELDFADHIGIIITDAAIEFKAEGFHGDTLHLALTLGPLSKYGFDLYYNVIRKEDNCTLALGKTGVLFFHYEHKKVAPIPEEFKSKIQI